MKGCRMFVKGHRRKWPATIFLPWPCSEQDPVQSRRFFVLLRWHFLPGQAVIVLGMASSDFGTNAMFPFLLIPDATFLCVSWTEALCSSAGKHRSSSVSSSQWQTLCHSAPEFHSFSLLKKTCEKSFLLPGHNIVASGLSLPDGSLLLTLGLQKDWIDGGFLITAHCPNNARHLKFTKHLPSHGLIHSHQDTGPACDGSK